MSVDYGSLWSPPLRCRGGEGLQEGLVIVGVARSSNRLLALAGESGGAEHEAQSAGLSPGPPCYAEVELVAPLRVGVPGVLVGGTLRTGELVQSAGGTAGPKQFLVRLGTTLLFTRHTSPTSPVCLVCVVAETLLGVEHQPPRAGLGVGRAVRTMDKLVTYRVVRVSEVTVGPGTAGAGLGRL